MCVSILSLIVCSLIEIQGNTDNKNIFYDFSVAIKKNTYTQRHKMYISM